MNRSESEKEKERELLKNQILDFGVAIKDAGKAVIQGISDIGDKILSYTSQDADDEE